MSSDLDPSTGGAAEAYLPPRFRRNVVTTYGATVLTAAIALVMTPVLARSLGPEAFGIWSIALSLAVYGDLLELGLGAATIKYVAEDASRGDAPQLGRTIATSFYILALPAAAAVAIGIGLAAVFPAVFDVHADLRSAASLVVFLVAASVGAATLGDVFGSTIVALQRYDVLNATLVAFLVTQSVGWTIVIVLGGGLVGLALVTLATSVLLQLARYVVARRLVPELSLSPALFRRATAARLGRLSAWLALGRAAGHVVFRIDTVVVGLVVGVPEAGIYAVGQRLAWAADRLAKPATTGFFPLGAELSARNDASGVRSALMTGTRLSLAIAGPLCVALAVLAAPAVRVWVGDAYADAATVVVLLAAASAIAAFSRAGFLLLDGAGRARGSALISSFEAVANLALSIALGAAFGLVGVALGTLIAAAAIRLGVFIPYVCRAFGVPFSRMLGSVARAHLPAATAAVIAGLVAVRLEAPDIVTLLVGGPAVCAFYLGTFAVTGLRDDERRRYWRAARAWPARLLATRG